MALATTRRRRRRAPGVAFSLDAHAPRAALGDEDATAIVGARLLPRVGRAFSALVVDDHDRSAVCAIVLQRTLDRLRDDPDGSFTHAGPDGWTADAVVALALLELLRETGREVDLFARPRVPLGDRATLALVGIDALTVEESARVLDTGDDRVTRLLRRGLEQVGQPRLTTSPCPAWREVAASIGGDGSTFADDHCRRCDPCNTLACLHRSRREELLAMPGLASLAGLGRAWLGAARG